MITFVAPRHFSPFPLALEATFLSKGHRASYWTLSRDRFPTTDRKIILLPVETRCIPVPCLHMQSRCSLRFSRMSPIASNVSTIIIHRNVTFDSIKLNWHCFLIRVYILWFYWNFHHINSKRYRELFISLNLLMCTLLTILRNETISVLFRARSTTLTVLQLRNDESRG